MASADDRSDRDWDPEGEHERLLVARFRARLGYVIDNFRFCRDFMAGRRSFNESVADLKTGQRPRARRAKRARLDPQIEFIIAWKLTKQGIDEPEPAQVTRIAKELAATMNPTRGRPADRILSHHVEALVALHEETCGGSLVLQSQTKNSDYCPTLKEGLGMALFEMIKSVDPTVTETAVANIIRAMPKPGNPGRKRFRQYFPLADHRGVPPEEVPGIEIKPLGVIWPIYCS